MSRPDAHIADPASSAPVLSEYLSVYLCVMCYVLNMLELCSHSWLNVTLFSIPKSHTAALRPTKSSKNTRGVVFILYTAAS